MNYLLIGGLAIPLLAIVAGCRLGWELLHKNGRMLLRMEALEKQIDGKAERRKQEAKIGQDAVKLDGMPESADYETESDLSLVTVATRNGMSARSVSAAALWPAASSNGMA